MFYLQSKAYSGMVSSMTTWRWLGFSVFFSNLIARELLSISPSSISSKIKLPNSFLLRRLLGSCAPATAPLFEIYKNSSLGRFLVEPLLSLEDPSRFIKRASGSKEESVPGIPRCDYYTKFFRSANCTSNLFTAADWGISPKIFRFLYKVSRVLEITLGFGSSIVDWL